MQNSRIISLFAIGAFAACFSGILGACQGSAKNDSELCITDGCPDNFLFACGYDASDELRIACHDDQATADEWCHNLENSTELGLDATLISCADDYAVGDTGETGSAGEPWNPGEHVNYDPRSEIYEIDAQFIDSLMAASWLPLGNDSARLELAASGYYQVVNVAQGDLAFELGLQSDDTLVSINGYDLGTDSARYDAYLALQNATSLLLTIDRGGVVTRLSYEFVN